MPGAAAADGGRLNSPKSWSVECAQRFRAVRERFTPSYALLGRRDNEDLPGTAAGRGRGTTVPVSRQCGKGASECKVVGF